EHGGHVPIVALTAHALVADRERCLEAGCDAYLTKPFLAEGLQEAIPAALDAARQARKKGSSPNLPSRGGLSDTALTFTGNNPERLLTLIRLFLDTTPETLSALADAVARKDCPRAATLAHKLRGTVGVFGDDDSASALAELEQAALGNDARAMEG